MTLADGALTVLWHSITWQYLSDDERAAIRDGIDALAAQADASSPFAHLTLEPARDGPDAPTQVPGARPQLAGWRAARSWANAIRTGRR